MLRWMCGVTKIFINKGANESGENSKESPGKEVEVVWAAACDEKIGALHWKEGDGVEIEGRNKRGRNTQGKMVGQSKE